MEDKMAYSKELIYKWSLYLDSIGFSYDLETESGFITISNLPINNSGEVYTIRIVCRESDFCIYAVFDQNVPVKTREQVANLMARLNYNILFGSYSIDFSDGTIVYKYAVDFDGGVASMQMLRNALGFVVEEIDEWGDAIIEVSSGKMRAEAAFSK